MGSNTSPFTLSAFHVELDMGLFGAATVPFYGVEKMDISAVWVVQQQLHRELCQYYSSIVTRLFIS